MSKVRVLEQIRKSIVNFDSDGLKEGLSRALDLGIHPSSIIERGIGKGMLEVGERYESGEYFLAELMAAASLVKEGMKTLEPILEKAVEEAATSGTVVIGTVRGDLHDIGKNIVVALLSGAGFEVHDLGVDVDPKEFVKAARRTKADIVAMSALLTTTIPNMAEVIDALVKAGVRDKVKVLLGGYHVTEEFAKQMGADAYANDAMTGVNLARRLVGAK